MNNFIATSFGFIKGVKYTPELGTQIEYTPHLRYAQTFKAGGGKAFMERHDIVGFLYNPYAQEPVRGMYEVKKEGFSWDRDDRDSIKEWKVVKAIMISESDVNWLQSKELKGRDLLSLEEAQQKAIELNNKMLEELNNKILKQKNELIKEQV